MSEFPRRRIQLSFYMTTLEEQSKIFTTDLDLPIKGSRFPNLLYAIESANIRGQGLEVYARLV
jgi:hypothetical protein